MVIILLFCHAMKFTSIIKKLNESSLFFSSSIYKFDCVKSSYTNKIWIPLSTSPSDSVYTTHSTYELSTSSHFEQYTLSPCSTDDSPTVLRKMYPWHWNFLPCLAYAKLRAFTYVYVYKPPLNISIWERVVVWIWTLTAYDCKVFEKFLWIEFHHHQYLIPILFSLCTGLFLYIKLARYFLLWVFIFSYFYFEYSNCKGRHAHI